MKNIRSLLLCLLLIDVLVFLVHYNAPVTKQVTNGTDVVAIQPANLKFGRSQVEQFIHDRPDAGALLNRNPALKEQLALLFGDDGRGTRVEWDNQEPDEGVALHEAGDATSPAVIQVPNRPGYSATHKCMALVYELHNVRNDDFYEHLRLLAVQKKIPRGEFVGSMVRAEFEVDHTIKEFLLKYPIFGADVDDPSYACVMGPAMEFSDYLRHLNSRIDGAAYLKHYRDQYDAIVSPKQIGPL